MRRRAVLLSDRRRDSRPSCPAVLPRLCRRPAVAVPRRRLDERGQVLGGLIEIGAAFKFINTAEMRLRASRGSLFRPRVACRSGSVAAVAGSPCSGVRTTTTRDVRVRSAACARSLFLGSRSSGPPSSAGRPRARSGTPSWPVAPDSGSPGASVRPDRNVAGAKEGQGQSNDPRGRGEQKMPRGPVGDELRGRAGTGGPEGGRS